MIVYLFPTEMEAKEFRRLCPNAEVIISGVGMVATAATIASLDRRKHLMANDMVVLAGIAGAYGDSVAVGSVVEVVSEVCVELPERFRRVYKQAQPYTSLRGVKSNSVHTMQSESHGAEIENMEGAALFAMSEAMGFRAVEVRAISNRVGESFDKWHLDDAIVALAAELKRINDAK
jgi:nucleoside phosphorylase